MKYTYYYDGQIDCYDDFLPQEDFTNLFNMVEKLPYYYGETDGPGYPPNGLTTNLNDHMLHDYFYNKIKNLETVKDLKHKRTYVNYFGPGEDGGYHKDGDGRTVLFYFNDAWDINDGGETKFSLDAKDVHGLNCKGTENYPIILSLAPIPNRLITFDGNLIHSATSFKHKGRFTFAMKFE